MLDGASGQSSESESREWWADGDFTARSGCDVRPLIDGRAAMLAMCRAFLSARDYILLAAWDIRADLLLVRGEDARAGADGSTEQRELIASLRLSGLDEEAIALWESGRLTVADVLGCAARRGVRVGVLLWDTINLGSHLTNDPPHQRAMLAAVGVDCVLDDSSRRVTHLAQSLHQKCAVIDGRIAFVGGVDLTAQAQGDYDRWDTHQHHCFSPDRQCEREHAPAHPWHDVHVRLTGPVVADVQRNIVERWRSVAERHTIPGWPLTLPEPAIEASETRGVAAQIVRTIPPHTYDFAPEGVATIRNAYIRGLSAARRYIYLENQYLWPEVFLGLDNCRWGERSPEMLAVLEALVAALDRGVHVAIVLPDHPNCGRRFTDGGLHWLREHASRSVDDGLLTALTLGNAEADSAVPAGIYYRPVYVHAKVAIIDDEWWMAGSANLNSRGMQSDAEINVAVLDGVTAEGLRRGLWAEHLSLAAHDPVLADPLRGIERLRASAAANLRRVREHRPLEGHVLPYIEADSAARLGVALDPEHGWLDHLETGAGETPSHYAERYL